MSAWLSLVHSCSTPKNVRENISDKNKQLAERGFNIELNLYDYVSDDFLKYAIERNNVFEPVNLLSAPIDTILSYSEEKKHNKLLRDFAYKAYLLAGKVVDVQRKRYHYVDNKGELYYSGDSITSFLNQRIYWGEVIFLQLETEGSVVHVVLDDEEKLYDDNKWQILPTIHHNSFNNKAFEQQKKLKTWNSLQDVKLSEYLYTGNEKKLERYSRYNMAKGDSVYIAVNVSRSYVYPEYSLDTTYEAAYESFSIPSVRHLEKQDKTGIFDMSFLQKDKVFRFSYFMKLNMTFNNKEALLEAIRKNAQSILVGIYRDGYRDETWSD